MKRMAVILMCALALLTARQELPARAEGDMARNHYALDVALDVENSRLTERIELTLVNDSADEWREVCLRDFMDSVLSLDDERCGVGMSEADEQGNIIMLPGFCKIYRNQASQNGGAYFPQPFAYGGTGKTRQAAEA